MATGTSAVPTKGSEALSLRALRASGFRAACSSGAKSWNGTKAAAAAVALLIALGLAFARPAAAQQSERAKQLGKQLMCMCGCNQVLPECNHIGCAVRAQMLKELDQRVKSNESDELILQSFIQEYGQRVLVVPPARGFNLAAWILPVIVPLAGLALVGLAVVRWRHRAALVSAPPVSPEWLARARREADREGEE
jgi:cytochrome c-type biogenesis protein CcmH/NrfF